MTGSSTDTCGHLHDGLRAADTLIAKALGVGELAQAAKVEVRTRDYLSAEWDALAKQAARSALAQLRRSSDPVTDADIGRIDRVVARTMEQWPGRVLDRHLKDLREIYELAHIAAARKALGFTKAKMDFNVPVEKAAPVIKPSFNLVDREAMAALERQQTFWIGEHYGENVSRSVRDSVRSTVIENGRSRAAAGQALEANVRNTLGQVNVPTGFQGTSKSYFEGLAGHAATTARVQAQINAFERTGYTMYEVVNPQDHRTCSICQALDGHVFYVKDGMDLMGKLSGASKPGDVKQIQPYVNRQQAAGIAGLPKGNPASTRGLVARGNALPPYHYKCRCNVDVTENAAPPPEEMTEGKVVSIPTESLPPRPPSDVPYTPPTREVVRPQIQKIEKGWAAAVKSGNYNGVRGQMEGFLARNWGITQARRPLFSKSLRILPKARMPGELGFRSFSGEMALRADVAKRVGPGLKAMRAGAKPNVGAKCFIHECIHGADRMSPLAYEGGGAVVTEVTTEVLARRVALDAAGHFEAMAVSDVTFATQAYQSHILNVRNAIGKATGWPTLRIEKEMERASHVMHTKAVMTAKSPQAMAENFVKSLPGTGELTAAQKSSLVKDLRWMKKDW